MVVERTVQWPRCSLWVAVWGFPSVPVHSLLLLLSVRPLAPPLPSPDARTSLSLTSPVSVRRAGLRVALASKFRDRRLFVIDDPVSEVRRDGCVGTLCSVSQPPPPTTTLPLTPASSPYYLW